MKYMNEEEFAAANVFGKGDPNDAFARFFVGRSFLTMLSDPEKVSLPLFNVTFEPGCRNNWHIHHASSGGGQIIVCTAGEGWYQEWGAKPVEMLPGTVVSIPAGIKHWHGAKKDSWFSHIAIEVPGTDSLNEWLEPVDQNDYEAL